MDRAPSLARQGSGQNDRLQRDYVVRLRAFLAGNFGEFNRLAIDEIAMAFSDDGTEMDKEVFAVLAFDKTITFVAVEPFNGSGLSF